MHQSCVNMASPPLQIPAISPTLQGQSVGKITAVFPSQFVMFNIALPFLPITQIPAFPLHYWDNAKVKTWHISLVYPPQGWGDIVMNELVHKEH